MSSLRLLGKTALVFLCLQLAACRSRESKEPAPPTPNSVSVELAGVDVSDMTEREKAEWSARVSELLAPCRSVPVSVADCVRENRPCKACLPAARYLAAQVRRGSTGLLVEAAYRSRFDADRIKNIEISGSPAKGPERAPIEIVEFADFECPACAQMQPLIDELEEHFPGKIRLVFKHFPLSIHPHAEHAARAAFAAQRQNQFWPLHAKIFANNRTLDQKSVERMAREVGLDMKRFVEDRDSEAAADAVARDRKQGEALSLGGTPSLFINGRLFVASPDIKADLLEWIELELELGGAPALTRTSAPVASGKPPAPSQAATGN